MNCAPLAALGSRGLDGDGIVLKARQHRGELAPSAVAAEGFGRYKKPGRQPQKLPTG